MGLMQLLVVGRSLKTARNRPSPYKLTQQDLLPRFGQAKPAEGEGSCVAPVETGPAKEPTLMMNSSKATRGIDTPPATARSPAESPVGAGSGGRESWWRSPFRRGPPSRKGERAIQGELSLEGVKVVRNDLNDADLELIPAGEDERPPSTKAAMMPPAQNITWLAVWPRIRARLRGIGRS